MRGALAESFNEADRDGDEQISFSEFSKLSSHAPGSDLQSLRAAFDAMDHDNSGTIDRSEFLRVTLVDALAKHYTRASDLIKAMDRDANRKVDKKEFRLFVKRLGFTAADETADDIFEAMDADGSGELSHKEVSEMITPAAAAKLKPRLKSQRGKKKKAEQHSIDVGAPSPTEGQPLLDGGASNDKSRRKHRYDSYCCAKLGLPQPPPPYGRLVDILAACVAARVLYALVAN